MPTPNRFYIGLYDAESEVRGITEAVAATLGDHLAAVNVYNEVALLGCKFAWMAVREASQRDAAIATLRAEGKVVLAVDDSLDETDPTFKHRAYLNLLLTRDEGKLDLSSQALDFFIKDVTGGVTIERTMRAAMEERKCEAVEGLMHVLAKMASVPITSVTTDPEQVVEALRYCDVRRQLTVAKKAQAIAEKGGEEEEAA